MLSSRLFNTQSVSFALEIPDWNPESGFRILTKRKTPNYKLQWHSNFEDPRQCLVEHFFLEIILVYEDGSL